MRLVLDSNILLSALRGHPDSPSAKLLTAIREGAVQAVACPALITEVREGLRNPYFATRISEREADEALAAIERAAVMLSDPPAPAKVLRDPSDDYLVALAHAGDAEAIVTGDKDLLEHAELTPRAIRPRQACDELRL